jgi:membrane protein implicated in regulation of membrane protease activity
MKPFDLDLILLAMTAVMAAMLVWPRRNKNEARQ